MTGHIPRRKIDVWLQGFRSIWVCTTRPDGRPHAVPVWYWWDGQDIYFTTPPNTQKARNLQHQPAIVVHAGDGDDTIILEGEASPVTDLNVRSRINDHYRQKYVDPHSGAQASIGDGDILYHVRVKRLIAWEYGIVSTRTDWQSQSEA